MSASPAALPAEDARPARPLRILLAGTPANAAQVFAHLISVAEQNPDLLQIAGVLTMPDAPVGRKRVLTATAVAQLAQERDLPLIRAARIDDQVREQIGEVDADAAIVVAYGAMLRTADLALLPLGWFNLHYSLLPRWRGAAPVQRSIMADERETGLTVFRIDEGLDTGPVAFSSAVPISALDDAPALLERLSSEGAQKIGAWLLESARNQIHTDPAQAEFFTAALTAQPAGEHPYASKVDAESGHCTPQMTAAQISALARGLAPHPSAWMLLEGQKFKLLGVGLPAPFSEEEESAEPGELRMHGKSLFLACSDQWLELRQVQPFGKKAMPAADWHRGSVNKHGTNKPGAANSRTAATSTDTTDSSPAQKAVLNG